MALRRRNPCLNLTPVEVQWLEKTCHSGSLPVPAARIAFMLLAYNEGMSTFKIARTLHTKRAVVERCIAGEVESRSAAVTESPRKKRPPSAPTGAAAEWVRNLAAEAPGTFGYQCEAWNELLLARHVRANCRAAGHPGLARLGGLAIWDLLTPAYQGTD